MQCPQSLSFTAVYLLQYLSFFCGRKRQKAYRIINSVNQVGGLGNDCRGKLFAVKLLLFFILFFTSI